MMYNAQHTVNNYNTTANRGIPQTVSVITRMNQVSNDASYAYWVRRNDGLLQDVRKLSYAERNMFINNDVYCVSLNEKKIVFDFEMPLNGRLVKATLSMKVRADGYRIPTFIHTFYRPGTKYVTTGLLRQKLHEFAKSAVEINLRTAGLQYYANRKVELFDVNRTNYLKEICSSMGLFLRGDTLDVYV